MKRSDLEVGESYYYDPSTEWARGRWLRDARRAVVVDEKRYIVNRNVWSSGYSTYRENPTGTAVLVDLYEDGRAEPVRGAVPAAHLRGPWEETRAAVQARREEIRAAAGEADAARDEIRVRAMDAVARAARLGFPVSMHINDYASVEVEVSVFEKMLDRLADTGGEDRSP